MADRRARHRLLVTGVVQGVGFRPFVYALARRWGLAGSVANTSSGVVIEVEGAEPALAEFAGRLRSDAPPLAQLHEVRVEVIAAQGGTDFVISESAAGAGRTLVSPDIATCDDCLAELNDPANRRYRYPFITCTNCGPRFTIITGLPYDRPSTTMDPLPLCVACAAEYRDPADRRFHAQTVSCPDCGPTLRLDRPGDPALLADEALAEARRVLAAGGIVAVKGVGGYHLVCDATDEHAATTLRKRKDRGDKPFAIMVADLDTARRVATTTVGEERLLTDPRRPVVLLPRRWPPAVDLAGDVAPHSPDLGVMLPYTPVHQLLFSPPGDACTPALVMTSGNLAGEPIVTDDAEARDRLSGLADAWLSHDRRIHVPCDDSVVRLVGDAQLPVRRSRGYAPLPIVLPIDVPPALAVGADLKNTFCVGEGRLAWLSAHVGDMNDLATLQAFALASAHLANVTGVRPAVVMADRHPGYRSTGWAERHRGGRPLVKVQHHHAHIASAMAENGQPADQPVIGFAFDGTGYGEDGAVWGGEAMVADYDGFRRVAQLRNVLLPGGDAGVHNPCRTALSHLRSAGLDWDPRLPCVAACSPAELAVLDRQLSTGLNTAPTSSMGRLFDALSSLAGVCHRIAYEAEAAMRFEGLARLEIANATDPYAFTVRGDHHGDHHGTEHGAEDDASGYAPIIADPSPVLAAAASDVLAGTAPAVIAARFHLAVADLVVTLATAVRRRTSITTVALSGGVFLNALLTTLCADRLRQQEFLVLQHHQVPPSDAGLALGQLVVGARINERRSTCA